MGKVVHTDDGYVQSNINISERSWTNRITESRTWFRQFLGTVIMVAQIPYQFIAIIDEIQSRHGVLDEVRSAITVDRASMRRGR